MPVPVRFRRERVDRTVNSFILLHEKFLQFDWLRVVVFQLNLTYLHMKITNLLRVAWHQAPHWGKKEKKIGG